MPATSGSPDQRHNEILKAILIMTFKQELTDFAAKVLSESWTTRDGTVVPDSDSVTFANDAVKLEGTVLYADLAESTRLVSSRADFFAAEIYKTYLYSAARIIRREGGEITAYDGDRVMGVFIGNGKNSAAAKSALHIFSTVRDILQPAIDAQYPGSNYILEQKVGIDTSTLFVAKTGIRGSNDLVWVGNAANNAAKMAALSTTYATYISEKVYGVLNERSKFGGTEKKNMWTDLGTTDLGHRIYGSNWKWAL